MDDIPVILLAAGASSRMRGRDKLLEEIDGQTLLARQAQIARAATAGAVLVALPPRPHPRYAALPSGVTALPVPEAGEGMGASLRTAVAALPPGSPAAMVMLADLPDLTKEDLGRVIAAMRTHPDHLIWRGATEGRRPGHPIIFSAPLFPHLSCLRGDTGGKDVVAAFGNKTHLVPLPGHQALADLDTPEDWAAWRAARSKTGKAIS